MIALMIMAAACANLAVFVCFPLSGPLAPTFTFVSILLWAVLAMFLGGPLRPSGAGAKAAVVLLFAAGALLSALTLLPQKDAVSPLQKLAAGRRPDKRDVYFGLLKLGVEYPALLPPAGKEAPL